MTSYYRKGFNIFKLFNFLICKAIWAWKKYFNFKIYILLKRSRKSLIIELSKHSSFDLFNYLAILTLKQIPDIIKVIFLLKLWQKVRKEVKREQKQLTEENLKFLHIFWPHVYERENSKPRLSFQGRKMQPQCNNLWRF